MEKSFEEVLVQFYVDQYRENAKRSTGKPVKLAHYIHRLNNKAKSIKYARFSKNETVALDKLHQEIKRLALITYYSNNKNARQILNREILPQLVRVDMEQFDEKEAEYLTEDFLKLLRKEYIGAICTRSMKELYNEFRSKELRREIVTLVPARPAICFISEMTSGRLDTPSNFSTSRNTILLTGRLSPIPIASVDTTTCVFFSLKSVICLRLISGGRLPYMTLGFMPFSSRRPAILSTDFFENTIKASPSLTSCGNEKGLSSSFRAVFLSYSLISYSSWHRLIR